MNENLSLLQPGNNPSLSRIPSNAKLKGDLNVTGTVQVDGRLEGNLNSTGPVVVTGTVIGNIYSPSVASSGTVKGNIQSTGYVKLMKGSFARGDIIGSGGFTIRIAQGCEGTEGILLIIAALCAFSMGIKQKISGMLSLSQLHH